MDSTNAANGAAGSATVKMTGAHGSWPLPPRSAAMAAKLWDGPRRSRRGSDNGERDGHQLHDGIHQYGCVHHRRRRKRRRQLQHGWRGRRGRRGVWRQRDLPGDLGHRR